ncbi:carbamoyltransferase HypF [Magnetofaba australis]|uniref:carbamoyltransferase HypF n=1 Tax=Magnetofaba australis TaxID=1472297 RepID=UPI001F52E2C1|nr:carbamoyltransferase HypF [Magnetofaba australis]
MADALAAVSLRVIGRVQGVGFRPFIYRIAHQYGVAGWVRNAAGRVEIVAQAPETALTAFIDAITTQAPPLARPTVAGRETIDVEIGLSGFVIHHSAEGDPAEAGIPPDQFCCDDCLAEMRDPNQRRFRYPFINCTQCGPRYTIIDHLPYDRPHTSMAAFPLCDDCRAEYENPLDRRFHAQPLACPTCGPQLTFMQDGVRLNGNETGLRAAVAALRDGRIVAVKGIGGYHLICDAANAGAVARLRDLKPRPHKPLAVMPPLRGADGLAAARALAELTPVHAEALRDPLRPVVLCPKRADAPLCEGIAQGLGEVGLMLPYSPLHHLLTQDFGAALVCTSANISGEPVLTDNAEVETRLAHVAQAYLHHNRPIRRPADDGVFRIIDGAPRPLRLGRGCAPLELRLTQPVARPLLAVGGQMKNALALAWGERLILSPHIGDPGTQRGMRTFETTAAQLQQLYGVRAEAIAHDAHPDYSVTQWARAQDLPLIPVYHHEAHAAAMAGELAAEYDGDWLIFAWDGVGLGRDGTLWGGEALLGRPGAWKRVGSWRPFALPGGDAAARQPWRSAAALCWSLQQPFATPGLSREALQLLKQAWERGINAPVTSAVGRLFDAASALCGVCLEASFEGQGPMMLEAVCDAASAPLDLPLARNAEGVWVSDWAPLVAAMADADHAIAARSGLFHATLIAALLAQAQAVAADHPGALRVGLGGGVFQNRMLCEGALTALRGAGFDAHVGREIPMNDAGLAAGQIFEALASPRL